MKDNHVHIPNADAVDACSGGVITYFVFCMKKYIVEMSRFNNQSNNF